MKLLIADDTLTLRMMLKAITEQWDFEPVLATDGAEAWAILQGRNPPRLALLDWEMPHLNGPQICQRLQASQGRDSPHIILLTSRTNAEDIVEGLNAGANDYVSKPFNTPELQARLNVGRRLVEMQEQLHQARESLAKQRQAIANTLLDLRNDPSFDDRHLRALQPPVLAELTR